jgi:hypothetical protein
MAGECKTLMIRYVAAQGTLSRRRRLPPRASNLATSVENPASNSRSQCAHGVKRERFAPTDIGCDRAIYALTARHGINLRDIAPI